MTPSQIAVALHYYQAMDRGAAAHTGLDAESSRRAQNELLDAGLLEMTEDNRVRPSDTLRPYVERLCTVPAPPTATSYTTILKERFIGEATVNTRSDKIAKLMEKYRSFTPLAKL